MVSRKQELQTKKFIGIREAEAVYEKSGGAGKQCDFDERIENGDRETRRFCGDLCGG